MTALWWQSVEEKGGQMVGKTKFPIIQRGGKSLLVKIFCTLLTDTDKIECEHFLWSFEFWWVGIRVVQTDFLKVVRKAVPKRLIRLLKCCYI